jgi:hypothetical protein
LLFPFSTASLLLLRHARQAHGRQFMKTLLYDTKDFAHQSAMQLVSSYYDKTKTSFQEIYHYGTIENSEKPTSDEETEDKEAVQDLWGEAPQRPQRGGMVYTFGKVDFQVRYSLFLLVLKTLGSSCLASISVRVSFAARECAVVATARRATHHVDGRAGQRQ